MIVPNFLYSYHFFKHYYNHNNIYYHYYYYYYQSYFLTAHLFLIGRQSYRANYFPTFSSKI